jgi:hypothetical protein
MTNEYWALTIQKIQTGRLVTLSCVIGVNYKIVIVTTFNIQRYFLVLSSHTTLGKC